MIVREVIGMVCQECQQRPATLHFTKIVNGEKTEVSLCEKCSQEKSGMFIMNGGANFSIHHLLSGLLNDHGFQPTNQSSITSEKDIRCEHCHMSFSQFAHVGRFGCANCYRTFNNQLDPIIKRLHSGNTEYKGKIPTRIGGNISLRKKVKNLKLELKECIDQEEFEKAAILRDEIRALEKRATVSEDGSDID